MPEPVGGGPLSPDSLVLPTPVAMILDNLDRFAKPYADSRAEGHDHVYALTSAIGETLREDDPDAARVIFAFLRGDMDAKFGTDAGDQVGTLLIDNLENHYAMEVFLSEAPQPDDSMKQIRNIADFAEAVCTDTRNTYAYRRALDGFPTVAQSLLTAVVEQIVDMASTARTRTGRKVKIEQAEKTIALLGRKARGVPGDVRAVNQTIWCDALVATLKPLRK
jgi:hypothetical protein